MSGKDTLTKAIQFLKDNPDQAAKDVALGLQFADKFKDTANYDHHWPTAYGLERIICAQGGSCDPPAELPRAQWDALWEKVKEEVAAYYKMPAPK